MGKINWIILSLSSERGIQYGVGTFIKQLAAGLSENNDLFVYVLELEHSVGREFEIKNDKNITFFKIPIGEKVTEIDSKKNQEKIGCALTSIVSQYIHNNEKTIIHMNFLFQYFLAKELKQYYNGIVIFTQHVFAFDEILKDNFFDIEKETYLLSDRIITVTAHGKEHLIKKGVDANKINIIYNGIDPGLFKMGNKISIKEKYGFQKNDLLILYSGRIDSIKGLDYLAKAFEILLKKKSNCRLVIAGDGDFNLLIKFTKSFSSNVSFLGLIPFDDLIPLYYASTIGVIPSLEEHCSYVALEMLHSGLPVVASNIGGLKEIFIHDENAFLVDTVPDQTNIYGIAPNIDQLADFMYNLLTDDQLRKKFSQNAIIRANEYFSTNKMASNYVESIANLK
jgi:glycosyltransferase involved in cell wall biosynthesis